jgi:sec-independent protein translocase protein TatA
MNLGLPEILIVLVIVLLLFGPGRISKIAGELGNSIRSFRDGLKDDKKDASNKDAPGDDDQKDKPTS